MRSITPMKAAKIGYIMVSVLLCMMGTLLVLYPEISIRLTGILCGILLISFGIIKLIGYFSKDLFRLAFENDLVSGILLIAVGGSLLFYSESTFSFFCTVFGILILINSLFKIQIALDARPFGIEKWWMILIAAILTGLLGIALIFCPTQSVQIMMRLLGVSFIWDGILNFSTMITAVKIVRNQYPNEIEVDYTEK